MDSQKGLKRLGAAEFKSQLGPNLLRGFAASILVHASVISLLLWIMPERSKEIVIEITTPSHPFTPPRDSAPPRPVISRPKPPSSHSIPVPVVDEPVFDSTKVVFDEPQFPVTGIPGFDTNLVDSGFPAGDTGISAGLQDPPWLIFVSREMDPIPLDINPNPDYPEMARRAGMEGKVIVWVKVDTEGNVIEYHVENAKPAGLGFEDAVLKVIPHWKFTPAIQQNHPIAVWVSVPFRFKVNK
jgi:protein TonB